MLTYADVCCDSIHLPQPIPLVCQLQRLARPCQLATAASSMCTFVPVSGFTEQYVYFCTSIWLYFATSLPATSSFCRGRTCWHTSSRQLQLLRCQYLYFCTSNASKLNTREQSKPLLRCQYLYFCTFVLVTQVN